MWKFVNFKLIAVTTSVLGFISGNEAENGIYQSLLPLGEG